MTDWVDRMVSKLVDKGFFVKKQSIRSNREFELSLTLLGRKTFHAHERLHGGDMERLVESLSAFSLSQIATLSVLLESLAAVMVERLSDRPK